MRFALGMDNKEIARALGRTDGATKVLIHRAIKQLEEIVAASRRRCERMSAQPQRTDVEALLSRALAPVDPPEHLAPRARGARSRRSRRWPPTSSRPGSCARCTIRAPGCARRRGRRDRHRRRGRRSPSCRPPPPRPPAQPATPIRSSSRPARCARSPTRSSVASAADADPGTMSTQTETTCYRHSGPRDARLVLELRAADLPGLHDARARSACAARSARRRRRRSSRCRVSAAASRARRSR